MEDSDDTSVPPTTTATTGDERFIDAEEANPPVDFEGGSDEEEDSPPDCLRLMGCLEFEPQEKGRTERVTGGWSEWSCLRSFLVIMVEPFFVCGFQTHQS